MQENARALELQANQPQEGKLVRPAVCTKRGDDAEAGLPVGAIPRYLRKSLGAESSDAGG